LADRSSRRICAEFETNLRRERQLEGIAKAKAAGVYKGRKPTISGIETSGTGPLRSLAWAVLQRCLLFVWPLKTGIFQKNRAGY
jgi:DNA invertase Pin-like site-specific DNA recombinase